MKTLSETVKVKLALRAVVMNNSLSPSSYLLPLGFPECKKAVPQQVSLQSPTALSCLSTGYLVYFARILVQIGGKEHSEDFRYPCGRTCIFSSEKS